MPQAKSVPPFRRLRIFAFDPAASRDLQTALINEAIIKLPWEGLEVGPVGDYVEMVDYDPASGGFYAPVDLNDRALLVQDGLPPSEGNPKVHQQMVYAVTMLTIRNFERALGRRVLWQARPPRYFPNRYVDRLRLYPHALREANAYYSPAKKALLFGYFKASRSRAGNNMPGGLVFSCLSHDIIAHETTHAILDGLHRRLSEPSNPDCLAFHEGFADLVALFQHFTLPGPLRHLLSQQRGDLSRQSLLTGLASQFGHAIGHYGALRSAIDAVDPATGLPTTTLATVGTEPHDRGAVLVAAVFDAFVSVYRARVADLLRIATGDSQRFPDRDIHPDLVGRLADEASKVAGHLLRMCVRGLDYLPPMDVTFGDFLRAVITADADLVPEDERGYRIALAEAFRRRGIVPSDCRSLSIDNLMWGPPESDLPAGWLECLDTRKQETREETWKLEQNNCRVLKEWLLDHPEEQKVIAVELGICIGDGPKTIRQVRNTHKPHFEVHSVRVVNRAGPDGLRQSQIILSITQERRGFRTDQQQRQADERGRPADGSGKSFTFRGGATVIADLATRVVKYVIRKNIASNERLARQRDFLLNPKAVSAGATYFAEAGGREPFALLHRML